MAFVETTGFLNNNNPRTFDEEKSYAQIISSIISNRLENSSFNDETSMTSSCSVVGVNEFFCECNNGLDYNHRSRFLILLRWLKMLIRKLANLYLGSPILLALLPLCFGLCIGFVIGRYFYFHTKEEYILVEGEDENSTHDGVGGEVRNENERLFRSCGGEKTLYKAQEKNLQEKSFIMCATLFSKTIISTFVHFVQHQISGSPSTLSSMYSLDNKDEDCNDDVDHLITPTSEYQSEGDEERDDAARIDLRSEKNTTRESGIEDLSQIPRHLAVIMDGNRRYGRNKYGSATKGHWDGSRTLVDFAKWCIAEGVQILTVYAFSTENWNRHPTEVAALMRIFCKYCDELRVEALQRGIRLRVLSTETDRIPADVAEGIQRMVEETKHCNKFTMNICLSYGSRGEILNACKAIASDVSKGEVNIEDITEKTFESKMLTGSFPDPDVVIRTSGEFRLSNFLLWQLAYSEMFFLQKQWPELNKNDLLGVIRTYAGSRKRRYGK